MKNTGFAKSNDGLIHRVAACNGEYTLCGDAWDGDANGDIEKDPFAWTECKAQPITCPKCCAEILNCKNLKTKPAYTI